MQSAGRKLTNIMMVPIHNLSVEYGIRTVKQTYGNNFNDVAEVSNGL